MSVRDTLLIGKGYWGSNLARNLEALGRLGWIADSDPEVLKAAGKEYPQVSTSLNLQELLKNPKIHNVFIATPPNSHAGLALDALRSGKDVFVEKPMADLLKDAEQMVRVANECKKILMVGHILLYHPAIIRIKQMIKSGELGKVQYIYSNRLNFGQIRTQENSLWSFAPHDIAVINHLIDETPVAVSATGSDTVTRGIHDFTHTDLEYQSDVKAHIFVSWLHPYKEQRLVVIGTKKMLVFADTADEKLVAFDHEVEWINRRPVPKKADPVAVPIESWEPLRRQCEAFFEAVKTRRAPISSGDCGLSVIQVLDASDQSIRNNGKKIYLKPSADSGSFFAHESSRVDPDAKIGEGTKIWHFCHVMKNAVIGKSCILGQNVFVAEGVTLGDRVKIQNNVSLYSGITVEDDVFLGPSCVLTNVTNPRSQVHRHNLYEKTVIRKGATVGANATILCGIEIGQYAFIAAGAVVTKSVPDYALMMGVPAQQKGWMSRHGHPLATPGPDADGVMICPETGFRYQEVRPGILKCLDWNENAELPETLRIGNQPYGKFKVKRS